jgi:hypothetical protein
MSLSCVQAWPHLDIISHTKSELGSSLCQYGKFLETYCSSVDNIKKAGDVKPFSLRQAVHKSQTLSCLPDAPSAAGTAASEQNRQVKTYALMPGTWCLNQIFLVHMFSKTWPHPSRMQRVLRTRLWCSWRQLG